MNPCVCHRACPCKINCRLVRRATPHVMWRCYRQYAAHLALLTQPDDISDQVPQLSKGPMDTSFVAPAGKRDTGRLKILGSSYDSPQNRAVILFYTVLIYKRRVGDSSEPQLLRSVTDGERLKKTMRTCGSAQQEPTGLRCGVSRPKIPASSPETARSCREVAGIPSSQPFEYSRPVLCTQSVAPPSPGLRYCSLDGGNLKLSTYRGGMVVNVAYIGRREHNRPIRAH